jgi:hypothetical protein
MQKAFRGRKKDLTQNIMVAVDFDLKFTYVFAGWEGSALDALVLANAIERDDGFTVGFLPPYRGVRYHLTEYGNRNHPTNEKELFNLRHSSLHVTIERAFGALKNRFHILDNKPFHPYKTQVKLVLACCILHNWILGFGIDPVVPNEEGFTRNPPDPHDQDLDTESHAQEPDLMTLRRDAICTAMWEGRGTSMT